MQPVVVSSPLPRVIQTHAAPPNNSTHHDLTHPSTDGGVQQGSEVLVLWNNPHSLITFETFSLIEHVLFCYISPVIVCVGMPANVLNCVVFARQGLRDRMNLCLFCLSLLDLLYILVYYCASGLYCFVELVRPDLVQWWKWSGHKYTLGLNLASLLCSGSMTVIISVERCVCVLWPLKAASLISTRSLGLVIVSVVAVVHLLCLIFPLKLEVVAVKNVRTNVTEYSIVTSEMYEKNAAIFDVIEYTIVANVIPLFNFVAVTVATLITVVQLRKMMAWRASTSTASTDRSTMTVQQTALVKMLVIVSTIFIVTSSPFVVFSLISLAEPEFSLDGRYTNLFLATHAVHLVIGEVNSSINFFVYLKRSSKFREELRSLCGRAAVKRQGMDASLTQDTGDS